MRILFVRHGESTGNLTGCFYDSPEAELTAKGKEQALKAGKALAKFLHEDECDAIYSSPWLRAKQTCFIALEAARLMHKAVYVDERLKERSFAGLEGKHLGYGYGENYQEDIVLQDDYQGIWTYDSSKSEEYGVESLPELHERVWSFLDEAFMMYPHSTIVVFSHGGLGKMIQGICDGWPEGGCFDEVKFLQNGEVRELFFNG